MKNYVYIFHVDNTMEDTDELNAAWGKWFESLGENIIDSGNPFNPKAQAQIKNGTVTMDADNVAGYTIVKASSLEEAVTWAQTCPVAMTPDGSVSVYETMPM